jgi:hypothetical protein
VLPHLPRAGREPRAARLNVRRAGHDLALLDGLDGLNGPDGVGGRRVQAKGMQDGEEAADMASTLSELPQLAPLSVARAAATNGRSG